MGTLPAGFGLGYTGEQALQDKLTLGRALKRQYPEDLPGSGKLNTPDTGIKKVVLREEPVGKEEALFTTYEKTGDLIVHYEPTNSNLAEGRLVFDDRGEQFKFTNPTSWVLKVQLRVRQGAAGNAKFTAYDQAALPAAAGVGDDPPAVLATPHVRFCNYPEAFQERVEVLFNGNNLNHTEGYENFIQYMGYVLLVSEEDKWDNTNIYEKFAHPGCLAGEHRANIGRHRADTTLAHQADLPDTEIGSRVLEEAFWQMHERPNNTDGVDLLIGPLAGPFFSLNEFFPLTFLPKLVIKLDLENTNRYLIARNSSANGQGNAVADNPQVTIVGEKTRLIIPWVQMQQKENDATDRLFFKLINKPYTTEKRIECWVSSNFVPPNNNNGPGMELPIMRDLEGRFPDQIGLGFIYSDLLSGEGRTLDAEKLPFTRCNITKIQIRLNNKSIFEEDALDWSDDPKNNLQLWKMQSDFWGNRSNPKRYNGMCAHPQDHPDGAKWIWLTLNPNYNGGIEAIEKLDNQLKIHIWGDNAAGNQRLVNLVFFAPASKVFMCQNPVGGQWTGPERIITSSLNIDNPKAYNSNGGAFYL